MKLIDKKGRLFGKINVIDFLVLFLVIVIIPVAIRGGVILRNYRSGQTPVSITMPYRSWEALKSQFDKEKADHNKLKLKVKIFLNEYKRHKKHF